MIPPSVPEPHLDSLYQEVILDHNRRPRNFKLLPNATQYCHGLNPLCGDEYHLYLIVDKAAQKITDVGFQGQGCAISKASASIMTTEIKGKPVQEATALKDAFIEMLIKETIPDQTREKIGRLTLFEGVKEFPIRVKCATLAWHALADALKGVSEHEEKD